MGWIIHQKDEAHFAARWGDPQWWALPVHRKLWKVFSLLTAVRKNFAVVLCKIQADVMLILDEARINKQKKNYKEFLFDRK